MTRKGMIEQVKQYFAEKGGPMTLQEYKYATDAPIKLNVLKAKIGSWGRILKMADAQVAYTTEEPVEPVPTVELVPEVEELEVEETVEPAPAEPAPKTKGT
jgi:hypothetical protein